MLPTHQQLSWLARSCMLAAGRPACHRPAARATGAGGGQQKVVGLLHSTERAVRTFQRSKLWRDVPTQYRGQQIPPQVQEMLSAPVQLPSAFLEAAVQGFAETLTTYRQKVGELEAMLLPGAAQAQLGGAGGE
ncbi:uncharacterized protein HaLaN_02373, partial [Haematococcus lacustris]